MDHDQSFTVVVLTPEPIYYPIIRAALPFGWEFIRAHSQAGGYGSRFFSEELG
jgi:hypothetical protein